MSATPHFDVAIIGGGLSGLNAAWALRDRSIVVLEREPRAGGRVLTREAGGAAYDLGAVFAIEPHAVPPEFSLPPVQQENTQVGLFFEGRLHVGTSVLECLRGLDLAEAEHAALDTFVQDPKADARALPPKLHRAVEGFFHVIHPSRLDEALPARQHDALFKFDTRHFERGNEAVIGPLADRLGPRLLLDANVTSVTERSDRVEVAYRRGNEARALTARVVICATTAPVARRILTSVTNDCCRVLLERTRWAGGAVVALGLPKGLLPGLSYLVTPELPFNTVLQHTGRAGKPDVLLCYFVGDQAQALAKLDRTEAVAQTVRALQRLELGPITVDTLAFSDVHHWADLGPIIDDTTYGRWDPVEARPSERVFLAGDWTCVDAGNTLPFGTTQALRSGQAAAQQVAAYLDAPKAAEALRSEYLVETTMYRLAGDTPAFVQTRLECNVAYYGLVLQAQPDAALADYLRSCARESLWEYQVGFGITAEDSLLVLEGLLASGADRKELLRSAERLVELFYSKTTGTFQTMSDHRNEVKACAQGRSAYWFGPSVDATAHAAWLLHQLDPQRFQTHVDSCARAVAAWQREDGSWAGTWFPSALVTTHDAVRLLSTRAQQYEAPLARARAYLRTSQEPDGSWHGSVIDTANAVLTLKSLGDDSAAAEAGRSWLRSRRKPHGWDGEPVLYYWFEIGPAERLFFHCRDRGRITTAWATLALRG